MSHMWMRHVTHVNETCHTHEWVLHQTDSTIVELNSLSTEFVLQCLLQCVQYAAMCCTVCCSLLQCIAVCCSILQWVCCSAWALLSQKRPRTIHIATHTTTHTATKWGNRIQWAFQYTLQHTATHCNTLQHAATHCNTHCNKVREQDPMSVDYTYSQKRPRTIIQGSNV